MRIYPNRNPSRRRRAIEASVVLLAGVPINAYNLYFIIRGILAGSIKALRRGSRAQVHFDVEPGWFVFNIASRVVVFIIFTYCLVLGWRELRKALRK